MAIAMIIAIAATVMYISRSVVVARFEVVVVAVGVIVDVELAKKLVSAEDP